MWAGASVVVILLIEGFGTKPSKLYSSGREGLGFKSLSSGLTVVVVVMGRRKDREGIRLRTGQNTAGVSSENETCSKSSCSSCFSDSKGIEFSVVVVVVEVVVVVVERSRGGNIGNFLDLQENGNRREAVLLFSD